MAFRRFAVLCGLVGMLTPLVSTLQTITYVRADGDSGATCTNSGRHCITGMRCVNRKCVCPSGYKGDASFECVKFNELLCHISGESTAKIHSFNGGQATINLPCSYRASRFIVQRPGSHVFCGVEVHVTPELLRDHYVTRAVHVAVGVTYSAHQIQIQNDVVLAGNYTRDDGFTYTIRKSEPEVFTWGSAAPSDEQQKGVTEVSVDKGDNFVVVELPVCDSRIKFRAYDSTRNIQRQLPGVSIAVPAHAEFVHEMGDYPYSLCGGGKEPQIVYRRRAARLGLRSNAEAAIFDILSQRSPQTDNPKGDQCQTAMALFAASEDKAAHLRTCSFILTKKNLRTCLHKKGFTPIDVFNSCLSVQQTTDDVSSCHVVLSASAACRNQWSGPKNLSC